MVDTHPHIAEQSGWIAPRKRDLKGSKWASNEYGACWPDGVNDVHLSGEPRSCDGVNDVHTNSPAITSNEKREARAQRLQEYLGGGVRCRSSWLGWAKNELGWSEKRCDAVFDTFYDYWIAQPGRDGLKADWEATWRNWCRRETTTFAKPLAKGEVRVRDTSAGEAADAKARAQYMTLLRANPGKSEAEIRAMIA